MNDFLESGVGALQKVDELGVPAVMMLVIVGMWFYFTNMIRSQRNDSKDEKKLHDQQLTELRTLLVESQEKRLNDAQNAYQKITDMTALMQGMTNAVTQLSTRIEKLEN